jgi:hypothetical protein
MFHYPGFGCLGGVLAAGGCCNQLQTVSDAELTAESVADGNKRWQAVSKCKNLPIQCPEESVPFPFQMREQFGSPMDLHLQTRRRKTRTDLALLRSLLSVEPATSTGRVAAAWEELEAGLARGLKLKEVWDAAKLAGLEIPYPQFRVYVSRLRRKRQRLSAFTQQPPRARTTGERGPAAPLPPDPFSNLREQREKKKQSGFEFDPFSINKDLIG